MAEMRIPTLISRTFEWLGSGLRILGEAYSVHPSTEEKLTDLGSILSHKDTQPLHYEAVASIPEGSRHQAGQQTSSGAVSAQKARQ
jgi:hypothetical protein